MVRAGSVLPLLPASVNTLAPHGIRPAVVRRERVDLIAFPRGRWKGTFFRGEKIRSVVRGKRWDLVIKGKRTRRYRLQAALPFKACGGGRIFRTSFRLRTGRISVQSCR